MESPDTDDEFLRFLDDPASVLGNENYPDLGLKAVEPQQKQKPKIQEPAVTQPKKRGRKSRVDKSYKDAIKRQSLLRRIVAYFKNTSKILSQLEELDKDSLNNKLFTQQANEVLLHVVQFNARLLALTQPPVSNPELTSSLQEAQKPSFQPERSNQEDVY